MSFAKKVWKDRVSEYPNRRTINDGFTTKSVTVGRDEGVVTEEGDAFNAANMNDLENRINAAIQEGGGGGGGGSGTFNYDELFNKPRINGKELSGDVPTSELHIDYNDLDNKPVVPDISTVVDILYPVGTIYISVSSTNPGLIMGGTWESFGAGKTLVGVDGSDSDFNASQKTGGEKAHTLTIGEMPSHNHNILKPRWSTAAGANAVYGSNGTGSGSNRDVDAYEGGGEAHNNMQPYITTYFWKRTA